MINSTAVARRQRQREDVKGEIREAAREIFVRDGYQNFSMRKLASDVGYSPGAIYLYFKSKEELFRDLVEESFARLAESLEALARESPADPAGRLKRAARLYVDWGVKNPDDYQIAFLLPVPARGRYRVHRAFDVLREMVGECFSARGGRGGDIETASQAIWCALHGITSLLIHRPSFPWQSKDSVMARVIESAVNGAVPDAIRRANRGGRNVGTH